MIINTGQRTDIPAFYSKWFINRLKEGYVMVRNPYYPKIVTKFVLDPKVVDVIGFCTKNPRPMFKYLDYLKPYGQFWYITITGLGSDLEPNVPPINQVIEDFQYLSKIIGKKAIGFRYTPIIINDHYDANYHIQTFTKIIKALNGYTNLAVFGFLDLYPSLSKLHPELRDCTDSEKIKIATSFKKICDEYHFDLRLCSKEKWLSEYGINVEGCMLLKDYERAINKKLKPTKKMNARKGYCNCLLSNDIGSYNSCLHFCNYCYANNEIKRIKANYLLHDDNSPLLIGHINKDDEIRIAKQSSWITQDILIDDDYNLFNC